MSESYLIRCLALFPETMQELHGWIPDYEGLERALEPVRLGRREFSFHDLETIQNGRYWDFRQFWRFPAESDIEREIHFPEMSRLIQRLPLDEVQAIARLHAAFKYIQNVSVLLRFINPAHYGIISPPVEKVLEVRRGRTEVETYLHYLGDIREIRDHHGLKRAADADMALWVLQERVLSSYRDPDLLREFRADTWLLRRKVVNLLADLAEVEDPLDLSRALVEVHTSLAGVLAGVEFEKRLRGRLRSCLEGRVEIGLAGAIEQVARAVGSRLQPGLLERWRRAARVRDRFLCPDDRPSRKETLDLIQEARRLDDTDEWRGPE